jgi:hypothetical protein
MQRLITAPYYTHILFQYLKNLTNFHNTYYEIHAKRGYFKVILYKFLQSVMTRWRTRAILTWDLNGSTQFAAMICCMVTVCQKYAVS